MFLGRQSEVSSIMGFETFECLTLAVCHGLAHKRLWLFTAIVGLALFRVSSCVKHDPLKLWQTEALVAPPSRGLPAPAFAPASPALIRLC